MRGSLLSALLAAGVCSGAGVTAALAEQPWGYEQVSPPNKGEGVLLMTGGTRPGPGGDSLFYSARSPFAGVPTDSAPQLTRYVARRGADGWSNRGVDPALGVPSYITSYATLASSGDVSHVLVASTRALTPGATEDGGNIYMRDTLTGALTLVATSTDRDLAERGSNPFGAVAFTYVANDGRSAQFQTGVPLVPEAVGHGNVVYTWTAGGGVKAASVLPEDEGGTVTTGGTVGASEVGTRDPMPDDAHALDHVYFAALDLSSQNKGLYVRTGDETRAISYSRLPGAPSSALPAVPDAVGTGGRYLVFHTEGLTPLTEDTPTTGVSYGTYIYRYDVTDGSLAYVGVGGPYDPVFQMTGDGQTVAFQSLTALTPGAIQDQQNLYVWREGALRLVATPDPGSGPTNAGGFLHLLSRNGRYFAFTDDSATTAARVGFDNAGTSCKNYFGDPAGCGEVYLFDADANAGAGQLVCASCRTDGRPPTGHSGDPDNASGNTGFIQTDHRQVQTVTDDGTAFFTTPDGLVPEDVNGANDAYAFHDGSFRLISRATPGTKSRFQDATPDGKTIFFATNDALVDTDTDRSFDMYTTRQGAGFASTTSTVAPACAGSDCRDAAGSSQTNVAPVIGSLTFVGSGNAPGGSRSKVVVSRLKTVSGQQASLRITVSTAGTIGVSGAGLGATTRSASKAATYTVKVSLTARAKATLQRKRSLAVKATVRFTPASGVAVSKAVTVTFKQPKAKPSSHHRAAGGR